MQFPRMEVALGLAAMEEGIPPALKAGIAFRMRPFGMTSYYDVFAAAKTYDLTDVAGRITCPMLITSPEGESFWPGQSGFTISSRRRRSLCSSRSRKAPTSTASRRRAA